MCLTSISLCVICADVKAFRNVITRLSMIRGEDKFR